jgi:hypothetical protein
MTSHETFKPVCGFDLDKSCELRFQYLGSERSEHQDRCEYAHPEHYAFRIVDAWDRAWSLDITGAQFEATTDIVEPWSDYASRVQIPNLDIMTDKQRQNWLPESLANPDLMFDPIFEKSMFDRHWGWTSFCEVANDFDTRMLGIAWRIHIKEALLEKLDGLETFFSLDNLDFWKCSWEFGNMVGKRATEEFRWNWYDTPHGRHRKVEIVSMWYESLEKGEWGIGNSRQHAGVEDLSHVNSSWFKDLQLKE